MPIDLLKIAHSILQSLAEMSRTKKQAVVFVGDLVAVAMSIWIAYSLRIGEWALYNEPIRRYAIGSFAAMIPIFWLAGVYRAIFRYAGVGMITTLVRAFIPYTAVMFVIYMLIGINTVPRTMAILQPLCLFLLILSGRGIARYLMLDLLGRGHFTGEVRRVLIYGAGVAGQQLAASIHSEPEMRLCGYVDDDKRLRGQKLDGASVYWSGELDDAIKRCEVTDVLLAMPRTTRNRRREIIEQLGKFNVSVKTLPRTKDLVGGAASVSDIRPLEIEDLLGRETVTPNELLLGRTVVGKTVLVTGAGGSIGSELCRQIMEIGAKTLILLEFSEFALYSLEMELTNALREQPGQSDERIVPVLGSVCDEERWDWLFANFEIDTVYHAAAYKHVPLVESNPIEGIRNNVLGTYRAVEAATRHGVSDFILISTDKAVRPTNVMGATKRAAEQVVQAYAARQTGTRFSMVRFGNVLGSSGSVVPLFRQQIEAGGPITLTDRRVTRYFMTISEAASLVIQAGGMAKGGEVFVLDMGKPIHIFDLAKTMIELSGLSVRNSDHPDGDIEIVEIGLRPGEKLYEELLIGNNPQATQHPRILKAHEGFAPWEQMSKVLDRFGECTDVEEAIGLLTMITPEFQRRQESEAEQA